MSLETIKEEIKQKPSYNHWQAVGINYHNGIALPLSSLRTKRSCGIGEFSDLFILIDWYKSFNMDVIQLLPLNEMTTDFSPYNCLSSNALDPIYLSLRDLPYVKGLPQLLSKISSFESLNKSKKVEFAKVKIEKYKWLKIYFEKVFSKVKDDNHYQRFIHQNPWIKPYGLFHIFKKDDSIITWDLWPKEKKHINEKKFNLLLQRYESELNYYYFLQYLCFQQMKKVKDYASDNNILIKGDIPILINKDSVDVWFETRFFDLSHSAGCPPDHNNPKGQNWGFPLYNWDGMKKDSYSWWKRRLAIATSCYHIYRVDHVIGFFRIWAMQNHTTAKGRFLPRKRSKWAQDGTERLEMLLNSSVMLPIAEDLGIIPKCIPKTLNNLGICGISVMRWKKKWGKFLPFNKYPFLSVATLSTHDTTLFNHWWKKFPKKAKKIARRKKWLYHHHISHSQKKEILFDIHHSASLFRINLIEEYLSLYPELSHQNPEDTRINRPGTLSPNNWNYRIKPYLEEIIAHKKFNNDMHEILR